MNHFYIRSLNVYNLNSASELKLQEKTYKFSNQRNRISPKPVAFHITEKQIFNPLNQHAKFITVQAITQEHV